MKKVLLSAVLVSMSVSLSFAEGVKLNGNVDQTTNVQGAILQGAWGKGNKLNTNIGGIQGDVKVGGNVRQTTNVQGAVTNIVKGKNNESNLNIGGISSK